MTERKGSRTTKKILLAILIVSMLFGTLPSNAFAEVKNTDWDVDDETKSKMEFWDLAPQNEFVDANTLEAFKVPTINYIGTYINADGRTVIRMSYRMFQNYASGVWKRLHFKFQDDLYELIDFGSRDTGMYQNAHNGMWHDFEKYGPVTNFVDIPSSWSGTTNVKEQHLGNNKNLVGGHSVLEIPIDLVLKEGKTVADIKGEPIIQARLLDQKLERLMCVAGSNPDKNLTESTRPYNSYTFMTFIPSANNNNAVGTISDTFNGKAFYGANTYAKYNEDEGYVDVIYKVSKGVTNQDFTGEYYAFRQIFNDKFAEVLKPQDSSGTVAEVFIGDQTGKAWNEDNKIKITKDQLNNSTNSKLNAGFTGIQVATTYKDSKFGPEFAGLKNVLTTLKPQVSYLNAAASETISGNTTVTRYYIDKKKLAEKGFEKDDLVKFNFYSTIISDGSRGIAEYKGKNDTGAPIVIPKGSKIIIDYPDGKVSTPNMDLLHFYSLTFGEEPYGIELRSNFGHEGGGKKFSYTMQTDMILPADYAIAYRTTKYSTPPSKVHLSIPSADGQSKYIELTPENGNPIVKTPRRVDYISTFAGGSAAQTSLAPDIDEIFTNSKSFTGRTKYKEGKINAYYGKDQRFSFYANQDSEKVKVNGKEYDGYKFSTDGMKDVSKKEQPEITLPKLLKDMPISFSNSDWMTSAAESTPYSVEQVQAKIKFDLLNGSFINKIAPLNNEYLVDPMTGEKNDKYKYSGFAKVKTPEELGESLSEEPEITNDKNLRIDDTKRYVTRTVDGKLGDKATKITKVLVNYINHDGKLYDIGNNDPKIAKAELEELEKRQYPSKVLSDDNSKRVIGWTTVKLEDGGGKTAVEKFRELQNKADKAGYLRDVKDWPKAGASESDALIYDEESPIDENHTVYAVWGNAINLVLHSNNAHSTDKVNGSKLEKEITVNIPILPADKVRSESIIDTMTGATTEQSIETYKTKTLIKEIPKVPYKFDDKFTSNVNEKLKEFKLDDSTFVGWTLKAHENKVTKGFAAGKNNERIGQLIQGNVGNATIPKNTESVQNLSKNPQIAYVPNGFNIALHKNYDELLFDGKDIHLYANYRKYFDVKVKPRYKNIDLSQGKYGKYVDDPKVDNQKELKIGLMNRTAVTAYDNPTVHSSATYRPIGDATTLKNYNPASFNEADPLKWHLPGYDEYGQRKSYVSVVVPGGKEDTYSKFKGTNWGDLGIRVYTRLVSDKVTLDPTAPKNLHDIAGFDIYGGQRAKDQTFDLKKDGGVDTMTSATARKSNVTKVKVDDYNFNDEVSGYEIVMTNNPENLPTPLFDEVKWDSKDFTMQWSNAEKNANIEKITFKFPTEDGNSTEVVLTKQGDGSYKSDDDSYIGTVDKNTGKIKITHTGNFDFTKLGGKEIFATYSKTSAQGDIKGKTGRTMIKEQLASNEVKEMEQIAKKNGNPRIEFTVPIVTLNKVGANAEYFAEKWDPDTKTWIKVGAIKIPADNTSPEGQKFTIDLDKDKVKDGDMIRVTAKEVDKTETPSIVENVGVVTGVPNIDFVKLDLVGPQITGKVTSDKFGRYHNLEATLSEIPAGNVTLTYKEDGTAKTKEFTTKDMTVEWNKITEWKTGNKTVTDFKMMASDKFGNEGIGNIAYESLNVLDLIADHSVAGQRYVIVRGEKGAQLSIKVYADNSANSLLKEVTVKLNGKRQKVMLKSAGDTKPMKLSKGQLIKYKATITKNGKAYRTNPFEIIVK